MDAIKTFAQWVIAIIATLFFIAIIVYASRSFTTATVRIQVERVSDTVQCAKIVTSDGAALSCWKD